MLELNAKFFFGVAVELRHLVNLSANVSNKNLDIGVQDKSNLVAPHLDRLLSALSSIGAKSALAPAIRLHELLKTGASISYNDLAVRLNDIESRFADHLDHIKLFVLDEQESTLLAPAESLLAFSGTPIEGLRSAFPSAVFEIEEAAKCLALDRHTASVFHCMRVMEVTISALAKFLEVPDPVKATDRNWGNMLGQIKTKIDSKWPKATRFHGSDGSKMEALYVTLEAVKNPWRNATMHVETIYAPHEAMQIARCTGFFLLEVMKHCDEVGCPVASKLLTGSLPSSGF